MQAWEEFLNKQDGRLGKQTVDKWLRSLKVVHFDSANLYLEASEAFQLSWFEEHIRPILKSQFTNNNFRTIKVHLSVAENPSQKPIKKEKSKTQIFFNPDKLDPHATLENFVPDQNTLVTYQLLSELVSTNQTTFNPIYIWGGPGTGKTHLLMGLAHALQKRKLNPLYVRTETFTEHVVHAIRNSEMQKFRKTYRNPDVLLIDDVHLLARKDATQEEFFHTFNTLHTTHRQIILTSQHPPSLLTDIEPRLISRFEWGISLHLEKLSPTALKEVLQRRCDYLHFLLSEEVQSFLVDTFPNSQGLHRALEALILRIHLLEDASFQRQPNLLDVKLAAKLIKDLIDEEQRNVLTPQKIIYTVSAHYGIKDEDILGKSHTQECVVPRQLAMYLCRTELKLPFMAIGRIFSRDHSTVMTSVKAIQEQIDRQDRDMLSSFHAVLKIIK